MKRYKHVFFDLDATLWDFDRSSAEVLRKLFVHYKLYELEGLNTERFIEEYRRVTFAYWALYRVNKVSKETIRSERFKDTLNNLGYEYLPSFKGIEEAYLDMCPRQPHVIPYAHDVLRQLSVHYTLHIITNGFSDTQMIKLEASKLKNYFQVIVTSDCGYLKPDSRMFHHALELCKCDAHEAVMIGDSLEADVAGARAARIDQVFYNPCKLEHQEEVTHEISCLKELLGIL